MLAWEVRNRRVSEHRRLCDHVAAWEPWLPLLPSVTGGCGAVEKD